MRKERERYWAKRREYEKARDLGEKAEFIIPTRWREKKESEKERERGMESEKERKKERECWRKRGERSSQRGRRREKETRSRGCANRVCPLFLIPFFIVIVVCGVWSPD